MNGRLHVMIISRRSKYLAISSAAVFAVSFLLPSFQGISGFECFNVCVGALIKLRPEDSYFSGFVFTNLIFVACLMLILAGRLRLIWARCLLALASLHVLSWFGWGLYNASLGDLGIGYYFWLSAYVILNLAFYPHQQNHPPDPMPAPVTPSAGQP